MVSQVDHGVTIIVQKYINFSKSLATRSISIRNGIHIRYAKLFQNVS